MKEKYAVETNIPRSIYSQYFACFGLHFDEAQSKQNIEIQQAKYRNTESKQNIEIQKKKTIENNIKTVYEFGIVT